MAARRPGLRRGPAWRGDGGGATAGGALEPLGQCGVGAAINLSPRPASSVLGRPAGTHLDAHPGMHPGTHLDAHPGMHPGTHLDAHPGTHPSAHLAGTHPGTHLDAHPGTHLAGTHPGTYSGMHPGTHLDAHPGTHPSAHLAGAPPPAPPARPRPVRRDPPRGGPRRRPDRALLPAGGARPPAAHPQGPAPDPDGAMQAAPAPEAAPACLHAAPPRPSAQQEQRPRAGLPRRGRCRSLWPAGQGSITALRFLQEEGLAGHCCWEPMTLGALGALTMARNSKNLQTLASPGAPEAPAAPAPRRPRKQPNPRPSTESQDPSFKGVTLKFQINPDSSLHILPTYSPACSSPALGPPTSPLRAPEPNPGGAEALGPRRCASCRTQRTPLWRDAEDGTPLCNACGIRYKKYGTRCSSCWLVPRKNVQPKRLCIRCGVSLGPHRGPTEEM